MLRPTRATQSLNSTTLLRGSDGERSLAAYISAVRLTSLYLCTSPATNFATWFVKTRGVLSMRRVRCCNQPGRYVVRPRFPCWVASSVQLSSGRRLSSWRVAAWTDVGLYGTVAEELVSVGGGVDALRHDPLC